MEERATAMRLLGVEPRFMHHRFIPKDEFSRLLDAYDHNTPPPLA